MKSGFWKSDWFLGPAVVLLVFFAASGDLRQSLERKAYDMGVQASSRTPSDRIAVIAIDDASIANIGRWPWPRDVHANMVDLLAAAKAKVIGYMPQEKVVSIVARVAEALGYAHRQGVVHRDVKPANVMYYLDTDAVKVTDFGIARLTDSSKSKTGMVLGTPSYMSPEQLAGKKIEDRSDLFSLAVSLYQLLCGRLPFEGESMALLMFKISSEPPADILSINPAVPPALVAFLARALAKNPDERFQTGEEFAQALRVAAGEGPGASAHPAVDIEL